MKIIIVGIGKVGYAIAEQMAGEKHDLTRRRRKPLRPSAAVPGLRRCFARPGTCSANTRSWRAVCRMKSSLR